MLPAFFQTGGVAHVLVGFYNVESCSSYLVVADVRCGSTQFLACLVVELGEVDGADCTLVCSIIDTVEVCLYSGV